MRIVGIATSVDAMPAKTATAWMPNMVGQDVYDFVMTFLGYTSVRTNDGSHRDFLKPGAPTFTLAFRNGMKNMEMGGSGLPDALRDIGWRMSEFRDYWADHKYWLRLARQIGSDAAVAKFKARHSKNVEPEPEPEEPKQPPSLDRDRINVLVNRHPYLRRTFDTLKGQLEGEELYKTMFDMVMGTPSLRSEYEARDADKTKVASMNTQPQSLWTTKLAGTIGTAHCPKCKRVGNKNGRCHGCGGWIPGKPISPWEGSWAEQEEKRKAQGLPIPGMKPGDPNRPPFGTGRQAQGQQLTNEMAMGFYRKSVDDAKNDPDKLFPQGDETYIVRVVRPSPWNFTDDRLVMEDGTTLTNKTAYYSRKAWGDELEVVDGPFSLDQIRAVIDQVQKNSKPGKTAQVATTNLGATPAVPRDEARNAVWKSRKGEVKVGDMDDDHLERAVSFMWLRGITDHLYDCVKSEILYREQEGTWNPQERGNWSRKPGRYRPSRRAQVINSDGFADGGAPYTDDEMDIMSGQAPQANPQDNVSRRRQVRVRYDDGDVVTTFVNGTKAEIESYFRDGYFTSIREEKRQVVSVEFLDDGEEAHQAGSLWELKREAQRMPWSKPVTNDKPQRCEQCGAPTRAGLSWCEKCGKTMSPYWDVPTTHEKPHRCDRCGRPVEEMRQYCVPCERRLDNGPVARMLWRQKHPKRLPIGHPRHQQDFNVDVK